MGKCEHPIDTMNGFEQSVTCTECGEQFDLDDYIALQIAIFCRQLLKTGPSVGQQPPDARSAIRGTFYRRGWQDNQNDWRDHLKSMLPDPPNRIQPDGGAEG